MPEYTQEELTVRIAAIDVRIESLLARNILKYTIGEKTVDMTVTIEMLMKQRKVYVDAAGQISTGAVERASVYDYEVDRFGSQLGETISGAD